MNQMNTVLLTKLSETSNKRMLSNGDGILLTVWIETVDSNDELKYTQAKEFESLKDAEVYFESLK